MPARQLAGQCGLVDGDDDDDDIVANSVVAPQQRQKPVATAHRSLLQSPLLAGHCQLAAKRLRRSCCLPSWHNECLELAATPASLAPACEPTVSELIINEPIFDSRFMVMVLFVNLFLCGPFVQETMCCEPICEPFPVCAAWRWLKLVHKHGPFHRL